MKKFKELNKIDLGIPIKDTVKSIHDLIYKNCHDPKMFKIAQRLALKGFIHLVLIDPPKNNTICAIGTVDEMGLIKHVYTKGIFRMNDEGDLVYKWKKI